jgi:hypothetical protein
LFPIDHPVNPVAGFLVKRRKILLLLGEKAGMREDVNHLKTPPSAIGNGMVMQRCCHNTLIFGLRSNAALPQFFRG